MHRLDSGLKALMDHARKRGFLTFQAVDEYLPDEGGDPLMIDRIIMALEEDDRSLINDPDAPATVGGETRLEQQAKEEESNDGTKLMEPETPDVVSRSDSHVPESDGKHPPAFA